MLIINSIPWEIVHLTHNIIIFLIETILQQIFNSFGILLITKTSLDPEIDLIVILRLAILLRLVTNKKKMSVG